MEFKQYIGVIQRIGDFVTQAAFVQQVHHTQTDACRFMNIGRADSPAGSSDF